MIEKSRVETFINSFGSHFPDYLMDIEKDAIAGYVPVIRKSTQEIIKHLMLTKRPGNILEVGTAVGFSALLMHEYAPDADITTIENYEPRIPVAKANFDKYAQDGKITLMPGDAGEILQKLCEEEKSYDFIFMDAAKGQYMNWAPYLMKLLKTGGMLCSDNVLQDGDIMESRYAVTKRNRTIHSRMREYLYFLTHEEKLSTVIIPSGDGITISTKIGK